MNNFKIIIADPCWQPNDKLTMSSTPRGAEANYPTLNTNELKKLNVKNLADPNGCILVLWVIGCMLQDGLDVQKSWGFEHKQTLVWVKTKKEKKNKILTPEESLGFGLGRLYRQTHEMALIGINNTKIYKDLKNKSQRSVIFGYNEGHSKKPELLQDSLELMFGSDCNKLELFARRPRPGWLCLGNELSGRDIRDEIPELIKM
jgi:N6-adenosine-specific RNA methylase IME4